MPRFSVVITVYNKEKHITQTLKSVLMQTFQDFEIIILNDGSFDNSEAAILKFKDSRIRYFSEKNQGAAAARNFAIKKAQAEYIALLDADDIWHPYYLEEQIRLINKYPEQSVFATASEVIQKSKIFKRNYSLPIKNKPDIVTPYFEASYRDSILHSSTTVIKKEVFEKVGLYDESIKSGQDTDLYVRIGILFKIVFSPKVCASYNVLENSLFRSTKKIVEKADFLAYEKYEKNNPALKKFLDLNRYSLCIFAKLEGNEVAFKKNFKKIALTNLSKKQVFLLKQNAITLKFLFKIKKSLENMGIRISVFK